MISSTFSRLRKIGSTRRKSSTDSVNMSAFHSHANPNPDQVYSKRFLHHRWSVHTGALNVTVFSAGSFGTALAVIAARAGHNVTIWTRDEEQSEHINIHRRNNKRFPDFELPETIRATSDMAEAVQGAEMILHAIPAQYTPGFLKKYKHLIPSEVILVSTSKGIIVETEQLMSEAIKEALDNRPQPLAYLSGPSFAKEMIQGHPMALVIASEDETVAKAVQERLSSKVFRLYTSTDVVSVEIGGAIKNPLAIGAGMADGLGYGQSTIAGLVTRGCNELMRLSEAMGGDRETLSGLSGVGDLMLTSFSALSRNRTLGYRMGKHGLTLEEALAASGEVVEGVATAKVAARLCEKYELDLPLFQNLAKILEGELTPAEALDKVMTRPLKAERG